MFRNNFCKRWMSRRKNTNISKSSITRFVMLLKMVNDNDDNDDNEWFL